MVTIQPGGFGAFRRGAGATRSAFTQLTPKDVKALAGPPLAPDVKSVTPVAERQRDRDLRRRELRAGPVRRHDGRRTRRRARRRCRRARFVTAADECSHARVAVLGTTVVQNLFGSQNPLGQTIKLNGASFQVDRRARVEGDERPAGPGRRRDRAALGDAGPDHRASRRPHPDRRRGDVVVEGRRGGGGGDRDPDADALLERRRGLPRPQPGVAAADDRVDEPRLHRAARRGRGDLAARRRDRRDEHHARQRHRADARDRHPQGDRRAPRRRARAVPDRVGAALALRRPRRRRRGPRRQPLQDRRRPAGRRSSTRCCSRSGSASPSGSSSASIPPTGPRRCGRSKHCATTSRRHR